VGKTKGKRPLKRTRRRWEVNFKMDLKEIRTDKVEWFNVVYAKDKWQAVVKTTE
jgi:hypothetical protein